MSTKDSALPGFRNYTVEQRLNLLLERGDLTLQDVPYFTMAPEAVRVAATTVENVIGVAMIPLGIATNFLIDGRDVLVPMVVEEPSVIAAASNGAKVTRSGGGIVTEADPPHMIGQVELRGVRDVDDARERFETHKEELLRHMDEIHPRLKQRGGGARDLEFRVLNQDEGHVVVHLVLDCRDAMGANLINTACEHMAGPLSRLLGGKVGLRILSNLADRRCVTAKTRIPVDALGVGQFSGEETAEGIVAASIMAERDPYRAATHNKGIMNGIDAVIIASGNDWRGIEAGAHAYACRDGSYKPLATWWLEKTDQGRFLCGCLKVPMAVGTVGGGVSTNQIAQACLRIMHVNSATELARIATATGLAQNLSALRALSSEGIQRGHMSLHAKSLALTLGARVEEITHVVREVVQRGEISTASVREALEKLRGPDGGLTRAIHKAISYVLDAQDARGSWSGAASPRIFETAIVATALGKSSSYEAVVQKARLWLRGQRPQEHHQVAKLFEETAYSLAMDRTGTVDLSEAILYDPIFIRKTEILAGLALSMGRELHCPISKEKMVEELSALTDTPEKRKSLKPWALADLLSARILFGDTSVVPWLLPLLWEDGSVWKNPVSTAVAHLAFLQASCGREAEKTAQYLVESQSEQGYWSYVNPDIWTTAIIIKAFCDNKEFQEHALLQAVAFLLRQQNHDGGWGYSAGMVSDHESTAHVLLALNCARRIVEDGSFRLRLNEGIAEGLSYLKRGQHSDGLWTTWRSTGDAIVPDVLGHIIEAVTVCADQNAGIDCSKAVQWIIDHQDLDGGWTGGLYRSFPYVQSAVLGGLSVDSAPAVKGRAALLAAVNRDGGWGVMPGTASCASATGIAISEFSRADPERYRGVIRQALLYLLDRQKNEGTWDAVPEMYGPRPLIFYIPFVSHAFASAGLMAAQKVGIHP